MGHIETIVIRQLKLVLDDEDIEKMRLRRDRRNERYHPTPAMLAFCRHLDPCPICGERPTPSVVEGYEKDWSIQYHSIKMNCSSCHVGCGDWYSSLAKAGKSWNLRTKEQWQIEIDRRTDECLNKKLQEDTE